MPPQLPQQEDYHPPNYYYSKGMRKAIGKLTAADYEAVVSGIWNGILSSVFDIEDGYLVRPEQATQGGFADLLVIDNGPGNVEDREYHFLVVQCKRMAKEGSGATWEEARNQLRDYLPSLKPRNRQHRVYGVVAIGRWVEAFEFDHIAAANNQDPLVPAFGYTGKLHIARQCTTIGHVLTKIRQRHT
ncbi:hypothetical protein PHISP_04361 [Aspergillus sp. HF37]|nr:hypothetical protein PHISP_04361 [Aspergillus sp. HF37]